MADHLSAFRTPEDAAHYRQLYDSYVLQRWPVPCAELDVTTRFGATHVRRSGSSEGTPMVLIHPSTGNSLGWCSVVGYMSGQHIVFTPDTVGTAGRSVHAAPIDSDADLSRWLDDVLDGLGLERIHLVANSEGSWIAANHAALSERTERVATLTLIEPGGTIEQIPAATMSKIALKAMTALRARDKHKAMRKFNRWMNGDEVELSDEQIDMALHVFKTFQAHLPRPELLEDERMRRITCPTLLLLGEDSIVDPSKVAARAEHLMADAVVDVIPNAGHGVLYQHPELIAGRILQFIDSREQRASGTR